MTRINLLPWREAKIKEQRIRFFQITGFCLLLTLSSLGLVQSWISFLQHQQIQRNHFLQTELDKLGQQVKQAENLKQTINERQSLIDKLDALTDLRTEMVAVMYELADSVPSQMYLTELVQANNALTITGLAQSEEAISYFLHKIEASSQLHQPELTILENTSQDHPHPYTRKFMVKVLAGKVMADVSKTKTPQKTHL